MKIDNRDIYEQIGNLFYSIAADQHVKPLEVGELKLLISKDWTPRNLEQNQYTVSDETHCIILTMDANQGTQVTAEDAFKEFSRFFALHPETFPKEIKQRLLDTALGIIRIFKADNPFDNVYLSALKDLLALEKTQRV